MPKYIKDKNGKFKGSIPDLSSAPSVNPALPKLPSRSEPTPALNKANPNESVKLPHYGEIEPHEVERVVGYYLNVEYWDGPSDNDPNDEIFDADSRERKDAERKIAKNLSAQSGLSKGSLQELVEKSKGDRDTALALLAKEIYNLK